MKVMEQRQKQDKTCLYDISGEQMIVIHEALKQYKHNLVTMSHEYPVTQEDKDNMIVVNDLLKELL